MMPVIWLIAIGISALIGGATIAILWDDIVIALKGKTIAALGERRVGKTLLLSFLSTGSIPQEYSQTLVTEEVSKNRFYLKGLELNLKKTKDVSGSMDAYVEWKKLLDTSDYVFYLFRTDKIISGDENTIERMQEDIDHLADWNETSKKQIVLIGTYCDFIQGYFDLNEQNIGSFTDKLSENTFIKRCLRVLGGTEKVKFIFGSLVNQQRTEELVYRLIYILTKK